MLTPAEEKELIAVAQLGAVQVRSLTAMLIKRNAEIDTLKKELQQLHDENAQLRKACKPYVNRLNPSKEAQA